MFEPNASGNFAKATYDSTYASTLASQTTSCEGGSTKSTYVATLTSDGMSSGTADTVGNARCVHLARAAAQRAAFAAADAASTWITLTSYGTGANPKLQPGGSAQAGIRFGTAHSFTGGWKVKNVDIDSTQVAGIVYEVGPRCTGATCGGSDTPLANGFWLENSHITNSTGMTVRTTGNPPYPGGVSPYLQFCASGLTLMNTNYTHLEGVEIDHTDSPMFIWGGDQYWIDNLHAHNSYLQAVLIQGYTGLTSGSIVPSADFLIENSEIDHLDYAANPGAVGPGYALGEAGLEFSNAQHIVLSALNIHDNPLIHTDGVAVDFEGHNADAHTGIYPSWDVLVEGGTFTSNGGAAFLRDDTVFQSSTQILVNGLTGTSNANGTGQGAGADDGQTDVWRSETLGEQVVLTNNAITKGTLGGTHGLFSGDATHADTPKYDTPQSNMTFGASNTVH